MIEPVLLARVLTDLLKRHPDASLSRWLLYEVGVRRGTINRPPTKVDRIWRAGASAATAAVCPGIAVFGAMFGFMAALSTIIELARAPFSPSARPEDWRA